VRAIGIRAPKPGSHGPGQTLYLAPLLALTLLRAWCILAGGALVARLLAHAAHAKEPKGPGALPAPAHRVPSFVPNLPSSLAPRDGPGLADSRCNEPALRLRLRRRLEGQRNPLARTRA